MQSVRKLPRAMAVVILVSGALLAGCGQNLPAMVKGNGEVVELVENKYARSQPWSLVEAFLKQDKLDEERYTPEHDSVYFAEILHNRAEYWGIKTAFVRVEFEDGTKHALNAFETVDYGLIYVDCSGFWEYELTLDALVVPGDGLLFVDLGWGPVPNQYSERLDELVFTEPIAPNQWKLRDRRQLVFPARVNWDTRAAFEVGQRMRFGSLDGKVSAPDSFAGLVSEWNGLVRETDRVYELLDDWGDQFRDTAYYRHYNQYEIDHRIPDEVFDAYRPYMNTPDRAWRITYLQELLSDYWAKRLEEEATPARTRDFGVITGRWVRALANGTSLVKRIKDAYPSSWRESDTVVKTMKLFW